MRIEQFPLEYLLLLKATKHILVAYWTTNYQMLPAKYSEHMGGCYHWIKCGVPATWNPVWHHKHKSPPRKHINANSNAFVVWSKQKNISRPGNKLEMERSVHFSKHLLAQPGTLGWISSLPRLTRAGDSRCGRLTVPLWFMPEHGAAPTKHAMKFPSSAELYDVDLNCNKHECQAI